MMPTNVLDQDIGLRQFWPFYEEVERLNVGLAFHGGIRASQRMHGRFGSFIAVHTLAFPLDGMVALTGYIYSGAPEQFPKLRIAALEASCGWVPFLMGRMGRRVRNPRQERSASAQEKAERVSYQRPVLLRLRIGRNHFALCCGAHRIGQAALLLRLSPLGHFVAELRSHRDETQRPYRLTQKAALGRKRPTVLRFQDFVFARSRRSGTYLTCDHVNSSSPSGHRAAYFMTVEEHLSAFEAVGFIGARGIPAANLSLMAAEKPRENLPSFTAAQTTIRKPTAWGGCRSPRSTR